MAYTIRTVHVYLAEDGWRWHQKARNGRILAESGEAYSTRDKAARGARAAFNPLPPVRLRVEGVPGWDTLL